ncbi:DUF1641 domain-containing protein [Vulcanisaeta souniana]|uniref:DUF1641 domain-containing protein n=1 Tax=Vulcanisaeta souniana JCM 11219 TaxID=1293586 RepID=A0A830ED76_9CREN|nr:DUF1641 domain-containing protein [Vulcanisaeta souniana]BDR91499.1 hypothetical protein Vsou_05920 [Vulcanisaeta souniana JCM 11219]GGI73664.1 hypothetical protein GCM10007112_08110 [Vulcanisaeta souniana JCM 11219]
MVESGLTINDLINYVLNVMSTYDKDELRVTIQESMRCILCSLYGVSTNVNHEIKPVDGALGLIRALNDPDVRLGLGLLIELLRSMGKCLRAAEMTRSLGNGDCSLTIPCHYLAFNMANLNRNDINDLRVGK